MNGPAVDIDWTEPYDNGSPIFGYIITIRQSNNVTFETETTSCDGSNPSIVASKHCSVPISTLKAASFELTWGASVFAKVVAINFYGESVVSDAGNGAIILTYPDFPVNLAEKYELRAATTLAITWEAGTFDVKDGGSPVIDYRVTYVTGVVQTVVENVVALEYEATSLVNSANYAFTVAARNEFGYSDESAQLFLYCAFISEKPFDVLTNVVTNTVVISWTAPYDNGATIESYQIFIR